MSESLFGQREVARLLNAVARPSSVCVTKASLPFVLVGSGVRFERAAIESFLAGNRRGGIHDAK